MQIFLWKQRYHTIAMRTLLDKANNSREPCTRISQQSKATLAEVRSIYWNCMGRSNVKQVIRQA